ncbi:MAG: glutathione S-transferase N-terminal domain-containing protein [Burkholderiales bacterium]
MKLIGSLTSPFVRKTRIVLAEKRIEYEFDIDIPWNSDTRVPERNPLGKVPVLILDDGLALFDSRVIVEYLDHLTPVGRLLPETNRQRIVVKRWEALCDGILDAAVMIFLERKRADVSDSVVARQDGKIRAALATVAEELGDKHWCASDAYSLADIALGVALGYLDLRYAESEWRKPYRNLEKHYNKLAERPSFKATEPPAA